MVIGDQDTDGLMEIIVGSHEGEWAVRVFEHTGVIGDNAYTEVWGSGTLDGRIYQPAIGDQDHDGKREIVAPCVDAGKVYLFENWNLLLAPRRPYFFLSTIRESRVRNPFDFNAARFDVS